MHELRLGLLLAGCLAARAPYPAGPAVSPAATWSVYDGPDLVLTIRGEPGPLTSSAPPPPGGGPPPLHPFLSAAVHSAGHEALLKALLDASADTPDYLARLRAEGFRVERGAP